MRDRLDEPRDHREAPFASRVVLVLALLAVTGMAARPAGACQSSQLPGVEEPEVAPVGTTFYVATDGHDGHPGTLELPWRTIEHSVAQLSAGDTLVLRGGTWFERGITFEVSGTPDAPITLRAHPGEQPVIDGSFPEFQHSPETAWEVVDPSRLIFRSVATYPGADEVYGALGPTDGSWALVPYESAGPFGTVNEIYSELPPYYYVGPGTWWNPSDQRIYVRTQPSVYQQADGIVAPLDPDPRQTPLFLFPEREVLEIEEGVGHIVLQGLDIRHGKSALQVDSGAHHVTVRNSSLRGGRYHVLVRAGCHDLLFDGVTIRGGLPPWIAWSDVKEPDIAPPAHLFQGSAIHLIADTARVEIVNGTFVGLFDAIGATGAPTNLRVHHNVFEDIRDDVLHLGSAGWNVEFAYNAVLSAHAGGPSWSGSGGPPPSKVGTVWVHHNVIDTSTPKRYGRSDPLGLLAPKFQGPEGDGYAAGRTFGSHSKDGITAPAPWKIYHNTAIVADDVSNGGAGQAYRAVPYDPAVPHEVYNNIFVQLGDEWLLRDARAADGSQIHDGNLYWAPNLSPGTDLLEDIAIGAADDDFSSLAEFVGSATWLATKAYYAPGWESAGVEGDPQLDVALRPHPAGPAASGAVDLSAKDWPGLLGETFRGALPPAAD